MDERKGSDAWVKRTELAKDIKGLIDIMLKYYDPKLYENMVVVARLDGSQIPLLHNRKSEWGFAIDPYDGGSVRIDHIKKVDVRYQSQLVKNDSGMVSNFHDRIP